MTDLQRAAEELLADVIARWNRHDLNSLIDCWDRDEADPIYLAEEALEPLVGWDAIANYWASTQRSLRRISLRTWDLRVREVAPGLALAFWQMHWNADTGSTLIGGDVRVSALLRETAAGWRFIHYVEAPLAPMRYVRQTLENNVDPDFAGWSH